MSQLKEKDAIGFNLEGKNILWVDIWVSGGEGSSGVYESKRVTQETLKQIMNDGMQTIQLIETTGTDIRFDVRREYGLATVPETAGFTLNAMNARKGIIQKIYHANAVAPVFPVDWVKLNGFYTVGVLNIIYAVWAGGSRVEYWVVKG